MKRFGAVCLYATIAFAVVASNACAAPRRSLSGALSVELPSAANGPVIVSVTVKNNGSSAICINSSTFPLAKAFHPTRLWNIDRQEAGWEGVAFGEPSPNELVQQQSTVLVVRPHETLNGSSNLSESTKFTSSGRYKLDLDVKYSDCSHILSGNNLASEHILPLHAQFQVSESLVSMAAQ